MTEYNFHRTARERWPIVAAWAVLIASLACMVALCGILLAGCAQGGTIDLSKPQTPAPPSTLPLALTVRGPNGAIPDGISGTLRIDTFAGVFPFVVDGGRLRVDLPANRPTGFQWHGHLEAPGLSAWDGVGNVNANGEACPCRGADGVTVDEIHLATGRAFPPESDPIIVRGGF